NLLERTLVVVLDLAHPVGLILKIEDVQCEQAFVFRKFRPHSAWRVSDDAGKDCQPVRVAHADGNLDETWSNAMRPFPDDARNLQIGIEHVHGDTPQQLQSHQRFARAGTNRTQGPRRPSEEKGEYATQQ